MVTSDEQIADLFHVAQEHVREAYESSSIKWFFFLLSLTSTSTNYIAITSHYHCGRSCRKVIESYQSLMDDKRMLTRIGPN